MVYGYYYESNFDPCSSLKGSQRPQISEVHTLRTANLHLGGYPCTVEFCMSISEWVRIIASGKLNLEGQRTLLGGRCIFHYGTLVAFQCYAHDCIPKK